MHGCRVAPRCLPDWKLYSVAVGLGGAALICLLLVTPGPARGERAQSGNLIVSLNGGISPLRLPRDHPAPVALRLEGRLRTSDGSPLPRLSHIVLGLAGQGLLFTRGLPVCPRLRLQNAGSAQALDRCGSALVGRGWIDAEVFVPHQPPFPIHARLLGFNGRTRDGRTAVWVHAFSANPPVSIVLPFIVHRGRGAFRTELVAAVSRSAGPWPHLGRFQITLSRRFSYRGRSRSYLSASCPVPAHFTAGFLAFARAFYTFADGRTVGTEAVRSCRAR